MIEVPYDKLEPEALRGLIEEFVTREGTDYGHSEVGLEAKVDSVLRQLKGGTAFITFDAELGTATIVSRDERPKNA